MTGTAPTPDRPAHAGPHLRPHPRPLVDGAAPDGRRLRFGVVGSGYRGQFFLRVADRLPERCTPVGVVTRSAERGAEVTRRWTVPTVRTVADLVAERPDVVVVAVPWDVAPAVTSELVRAGVPVLAETPPAPDLAGLRSLWADVGDSGLVQVAEHSPFLPQHVARTHLLADGTIGEVTSVQVSSTHMYHAMSLVRTMLGTGSDAATVVARRFESPLADPVTRAGWTGGTTAVPATTTLALLDLGAGRSAVYDRTDNQARNPLRSNRLVLRGSHGEIVDDRVTRLLDDRTVVTSSLVRRQTGVEQDLEGFDLDHLSFDGRVLYRNAFAGARLADEDIAVAALLDGTARWVLGGGPPPYPLAEACADHALALAVEESAATGVPVRSESGPWAG